MRAEDVAASCGLPQALVDDLAQVLDGQDAQHRLRHLLSVPLLCTRLRPGPRIPPGRSVRRKDGDWWWWEDPQEALRGPVADGRCVIQDRGQVRALELAAPRPQERVLDLCPGSGDKALWLHDRGCRVVVAETASEGCAVAAEIPRLVQDSCHPALVEASFDLVVVDPPCSHTGILGRHPEAVLGYERSRVDRLVEKQRALLASATRLCAGDGRILYCTRSLVLRENQQITHALSGWRIWKEAMLWPDGWEGGGYACVLVRR